MGSARRDQAEGARELAHDPHAGGGIQPVRIGQGGGDGLDRAVVAQPGDQVPEQRRHVGPSRAADEGSLAGQVAQPSLADAVHDDRVRQGLRPLFGHDRLQDAAGVTGRIDDVAVPFSHQGSPHRCP